MGIFVTGRFTGAADAGLRRGINLEKNRTQGSFARCRKTKEKTERFDTFRFGVVDRGFEPLCHA